MASQVKSFTFTSPKVQEPLTSTIINTTPVTNIKVLPPTLEPTVQFGHQSTVRIPSSQIVKVIEPTTIVRPVSYVPINPPNLYERPYVIVDKKVSYGQPISAEEYHQLANSRRVVVHEANPVITVKKEVKNNHHLELNNSPVRRKMEVKVEESKTSTFWCCGGNRATETEVQSID